MRSVQVMQPYRLVGIIIALALGGMCWWATECDGQAPSNWSWIVASSSSSSSPGRSQGAPSCPSYCLNALGGTIDVNVLIGLWWCQGTRFPDEQWRYDAASSSLSILNAALTTSFCLDIADPASSANLTGSSPPLRALLLSPCSSTSPTQRWRFDPPTRHLQSLAGSNNSSNASYVYAYRPPGQANYYLYLTDNATTAQSFTMVDNTVMGSFYSPSLPTSNETNLILNGDLKLLTSFAPLGLPLDFTFFPNQQVLMGFDFVLCHWAVQGDLSFGNCSSSRCALPSEWCSGSNADENVIFLNWQTLPPPPRQGAIMQTVPTYPGSSYRILFDMKNPFKQMQSVQLSVFPVAASTSATRTFQILSNQTDSQTYQFGFVASGNFVNLTFASQDSTPCGPLLGNIQMYYLPPGSSDSTVERNSNNHGLLAMVILGWVLAACFGGAAVFAAFSALQERRKRLAGYMHMERGLSTIALQSQITVFSYEQLKAYTQEFSILIGEGGFGKVYFGCLPESGIKIAVKRQVADNSCAGFEAEVELLSRVHHRYIVKFLGYCNDEGERMLVFEYMPNKSLYSRLHGENSTDEQQRPLSWLERLRIAYQVAYALEYLHHGASPPVLHRDIKSANVLLGDALGAKLADLGISKVGRESEVTHWTATMTLVKGSRGYLDPYYLQTSKISQKSDVYSYGVLLLELVTGRKAITSDFELLTTWVRQEYWDRGTAAGLAQEIYYNVVDACLHSSATASEVEKVMEIARWCVREQPLHRPTMVEVARFLRDLLLPYNSIAGVHGQLDEDADDASNVFGTRCSAATGSSSFSNVSAGR